MRDIETEIWSKAEIDSARYRGLYQKDVEAHNKIQQIASDGLNN